MRDVSPDGQEGLARYELHALRWVLCEQSWQSSGVGKSYISECGNRLPELFPEEWRPEV